MQDEYKALANNPDSHEANTIFENIDTADETQKSEVLAKLNKLEEVVNKNSDQNENHSEIQNEEFDYSPESILTRDEELIRLFDNLLALSSSSEYSADELELIKSKVAEVQAKYNIRPKHENYHLPMVDYVILKRTGMTEEELYLLDTEVRNEIIYDLGGTQYIQKIFIDEELLGQSPREPNPSDLREKELEWKEFNYDENQSP